MHRLLLPLLLVPFLLGMPPTAARAEGEASRTSQRVGRIVVQGDSTYRITKKQLALLGITSAKHADVRRGGRNVSVWRDVVVAGEPGGLVFAARDTAGPHSRYAVFEVWRRAVEASGGTIGDGFEVLRREAAPDRVMGELAAADRGVYDHAVPVWFAGMAPLNQSVDVRVGPMGATKNTTQVVIATVYATWRGPVAMRASWNGHDLGSAQGALGIAGAELRWTVPADHVPATPQKLTLRNVSPPPPAPPARDVSRHRGTLYVDRVRLEGPGVRRHTLREAKPVVVTKAGPVRDPLRAAGKATHVILAVPAVVAAARTLAAHRTRRGVPSVVIPVTDVYDRYGHGEHGPEAIRLFVADLQRRQGAPLRYVVLAGDATFNRTDLEQAPTIPAWFMRSKYNGATASDRLYVRQRDVLRREPAIGRLPFRKAEEMRAYVDRVIRYETNPPAHASRRMMRFITSEGRFSPFIDKIIENKFRNVLADNVPAAYDVEVTYANPRSPFLWPPPELSSKVIDGLNEGALFYTYVGHGFEKGFDTLRAGGKRYGILHVRDVPRVDVKHTSPIVFVLACTTAMFDGVRGDGVGEALMKRPNGPVAYWGASRVCHPVYNAFIGEAIATNLARRKQDRLGTILATSRADAVKLPGKMSPVVLAGLKLLSGVSDLDRLFVEGDAMYTLLGDPALEIAFPRDSITVSASTDVAARAVTATLAADLPDGTQVHVALEAPRNKDLVVPEPVANPADPASFPTIRRNHALVNERVLARATVTWKDGTAEVRFTLKEGLEAPGLIVKAWCIAKGDVHQGATALK